ncbi:MAG: hypothetical protein Q9164_000814 [Protoblastenia rupestris]
MGLQYIPPSPPPTPCTARRAVQSIISCSRLTVNHIEEISSHLHRVYTLRLSNGSRLCLKTSPSPSLCLLRGEYAYLETEATVLELLAKSSLPLPRIIKYDRRCSHFGVPSLLTNYLSGTRYVDALPYLTRAERANIELQLRSLRLIVSQHVSNTYGPANLVKAGEGFETWREAFIAMFESVLMDGEDSNVNIPYFQIREAFSRWETYLDDVTEGRLLVPGLGSPENTLIDRRTNDVTGLLDFGQALWGDVDFVAERIKGDIKGLM